MRIRSWWSWWHTPVIQALGSLRQEDYEFEASFCCRARPCCKTQNNNNNKTKTKFRSCKWDGKHDSAITAAISFFPILSSRALCPPSEGWYSPRLGAGQPSGAVWVDGPCTPCPFIPPTTSLTLRFCCVTTWRKRLRWVGDENRWEPWDWERSYQSPIPTPDQLCLTHGKL
jgi:hypothetical protein